MAHCMGPATAANKSPTLCAQQENFFATEMWVGYRKCRGHLAALKPKFPGMRMVVSLSVGVGVDVPDPFDQQYLSQEFAKQDVLFFAAASNDGAPRLPLQPLCCRWAGARVHCRVPACLVAATLQLPVIASPKAGCSPAQPLQATPRCQARRCMMRSCLSGLLIPTWPAAASATTTRKSSL